MTQLYGVTTDYDMNAGRKRDHLNVWSGPFMSTLDASGVSLPNRDGYMLTTYNGDKVRVACPCPRTEDNRGEIDAAINSALNDYETERGSVVLQPAKESA